MPTFKVQKNEAGLCLLAFLQQKIPSAPEAYLKQLIKKGKVSSPEKRLSTDHRLSLGEDILLPESGRLLELMAIPGVIQKPLGVLYESREILVVDKPAGLAVHSSKGHEQDNLTDRVTSLLREKGQRFVVAPVHRLDLGTSGPVMFGKGKAACGQLGQLFMRQQVEKYYLALVLGETAGSGQLSSPVRAKGKSKQAISRYRALAKNQAASYLEIELQTGRQHQIRQQFTKQGHPLFGDKRYGGPCPEELHRLFLHCHRLAFTDPFNETPVEALSPLPEELSSFLTTSFTEQELKRFS